MHPALACSLAHAIKGQRLMVPSCLCTSHSHGTQETVADGSGGPTLSHTSASREGLAHETSTFRAETYYRMHSILTL